MIVASSLSRAAGSTRAISDHYDGAIHVAARDSRIKYVHCLHCLLLMSMIVRHAMMKAHRIQDDRVPLSYITSTCLVLHVILVVLPFAFHSDAIIH